MSVTVLAACAIRYSAASTCAWVSSSWTRRFRAFSSAGLLLLVAHQRSVGSSRPQTFIRERRPRISNSSTKTSPSVDRSEAYVPSASSTACGVCFVSPSIREAVFTVSPITAYSKPSFRADAAGHHRTGVEADPHPEAIADPGRLEPLVELGELLGDHRASRLDRQIRVIVHRYRRAERGHHAVTHVVDERAAVIEDRIGHQPQVPVQHLDHLIDRQRLRERREPAEVAEEHGPGQRLGRDRGSAFGAVEQRADDRLRHEPGEDAPHPLLFQVVQQLAVQPRVHPRAQDHRVERLGQEVLGAHLDAPDDALGVVDAADHDHRQVAERVVALDALEHLDAVHAGHDQVEQHDVGRVLGEHGERGGPVSRPRTSDAPGVRGSR